ADRASDRAGGADAAGPGLALFLRRALRSGRAAPGAGRGLRRPGRRPGRPPAAGLRAPRSAAGQPRPADPLAAARGRAVGAGRARAVDLAPPRRTRGERPLNDSTTPPVF